MINLITYKGTRGRRESMRAKNEQATGGIVTTESVHDVNCNLCNRRLSFNIRTRHLQILAEYDA